MNQSKYKQRIAEMKSPEWIELIRAIEDAKKLLTDLRKKRDEMLRGKDDLSIEKRVKTRQKQHDALVMVKDGRPEDEIAKFVGCSSRFLCGKIARIWRRRYRNHFEKHYRYGGLKDVLTDLRSSPPLE